jgi:hypothetical protein
MRLEQRGRVGSLVAALAAGLVLACGPGEASYARSASARTLAVAWRGAVLALRLAEQSAQLVACAPHVGCVVLATPPRDAD